MGRACNGSPFALYGGVEQMSKEITKAQLGTLLSRLSTYFLQLNEDFAGATSNVNGTSGMVPAPLAGDNTKYLRGDGTWATVSGGGSVSLDIGTVTEGSSAAASITEDSSGYHLNLTIPKGSDGVTPTLQMGTVTTGAAGTSASATMTKSGNTYTINLTIPRGNTGSTGSTGPTGPAGAGIVAGTIMAYGGSGTPSGYLLCDGSAVSRTTYSALYSAIGTTWGSGNGSTTFNVPNLSGYYLKGSTSSGSSLSAGLPNITGHMGANGGIGMIGISDCSGAFSATNNNTKATKYQSASSTRTADLRASFSASSSNSIYGSSTTVQPASKTVRYVIKY
jgi:microcystin-dependent protein